MNIAILGGGSAGWITALLTQAYHPFNRITVIESESIGILGAGEGTTPQFIDFLNKVNIPVSDLIKNCKATIKSGINFENWNGDNKKYFHSFGPIGQISEWDDVLIENAIINNIQIDSLNFAKKAASLEKVGFSFKDIITDNRDPISNFNYHCIYALHFDARSLAQYFRKIAEERGIIRVEGELQSVVADDCGNIKQIQLKNNKQIDCDFVFDCSGFARLLIGKHFETEWISYNKHLPMNTALPFFIEHDDNVSPQTDAIAMKYGWIWKIPVQGRYGCGYVFDSNFINEDQALQEAEEYFNFELKSPRTFKFEAGTFRDTLVKNCMAVGLSQSFIEPLEATSIFISYTNLTDFLIYDGFSSKTESFYKKFNSICLDRNTEVRDFVYLHYITKRNDSDFWRNFQSNNPMIDTVHETLEWMKETKTIGADIQKKAFSIRGWMQVANGLDLFKYDTRNRKTQVFSQEYINSYNSSFLKNQENMLKICISHKDFLNYLKQ
jgi:tryptophan halogenase